MRLCSVDDCARPHRARGLCGTHYNQRDPNRHRKVTVQCARCGRDCQKEPTRGRRYGALYCSMTCRTQEYLSTEEGQTQLRRARESGLPAAWAARATPQARARRKARRAARGTSGWCRFAAGRCQYCGAPYLAICTSPEMDHLSRYCSDGCKRRASSSRRRGRERGVVSRPYSRWAIYERDGWRCHICHKRVSRRLVSPDPGSPTIDHLIPVSAGGDDVSENVRLAHRLCNSRRRELGDVQLLLFG